MSFDNKKARILLVEDEKGLQKTLKLNLELEGYEVVPVGDGKKALETVKSQRFHLVILDVMLPYINGYQVCERIRLDDQTIPILFLTAKSAGAERVKGLQKGGDDYLTKPFNLEELLLRVKNLLKRSDKGKAQSHKLHQYRFGENKVDFTTYKAETKEGTIDLSKREAKLLRLLIDKKNEVVSREEILEAVWGYDVFPTTRTVDNYILKFRKCFEPDPKHPTYFQSVRGVGYKFVDQTE